MAVGLSVATAAEGYTTMRALVPAIGFHAAMAAGGVQLVGLGNRIGAKTAVRCEA